MKSFIKTNVPVIGEDINALRDVLGLSTGDACWLYGISMTRWMEMTSNRLGHKDPVPNPTLALMVRALSSRPDISPIPVAPSAEEILGMINELGETVDKKRLAIMFGCEGSSGYRWITMRGKISPVLERLFLVFRMLLKSALAKSAGQAIKFLDEWDEMVEDEARHRGISDIFSVGKWNVNEADSGPIPLGKRRPVRGEDLSSLRERLGIGTHDACWLFGLSMTRWMMVAMKPGQIRTTGASTTYVHGSKDPVNNATLALLVRILKKYPEACPIFTPVTAQEVYEKILKVRPDLDKKRFSIMFGCESSSGHRWIAQNSKISPVVERTLKVFMTMFSAALQTSHAKASDFLIEWDRMVELEAQARGIPNIFRVGRWTETEKTQEIDGAKSAASQIAKTAKRELKQKKMLDAKAQKVADKVANKLAREQEKEALKLAQKEQKKADRLAAKLAPKQSAEAPALTSKPVGKVFRVVKAA